MTVGRPLRLATIVLAAGRGSRMGGGKMMREVAGKPLISRVLQLAEQVSIRPIIIVLGEDAATVKSLLGTRDVTYVVNDEVGDGLSKSLKVGIRHLPAGCDGAIVLLGDMPAVSSGTLEALRMAAVRMPDCDAIVPTYQGRRGNPVLLMRPVFAAIAGLDGDVGARGLLTGPRVVELPVPDPGILLDIDTPEHSAAYEANLAAGS